MERISILNWYKRKYYQIIIFKLLKEHIIF